LRTVGLADDARRRAGPPGFWRCRDHERQHGAAALHLSRRPARSGCGDQRARRIDLGGDRAECRGRNSVDRIVAMAVRDQCASRRRRPGVREPRAAADPARPSSYRLAQCIAERGDLWRADHRHRQPAPAVHARRVRAGGCCGRRRTLRLAATHAGLPDAGTRTLCAAGVRALRCGLDLFVHRAEPDLSRCRSSSKWCSADRRSRPAS